LLSFALLAAPNDPLTPAAAPNQAAPRSDPQPPEKPTEPDTNPTPSEEDPIAGLPQGDAPPLPAIVNWRLGNSVLAENQLRKRISLGGWWRFAASAEREGRVVRPEMGWIEMPDSGRLEDAKMLDSELRPVLKTWRGQSLEKLPWLCIERDLSIPAEWVSTRIYLKITGAWKEAEVYCFDVPIDGFAQGDSRWFDLTEDLAYGGTVRLDMRLKRPEEGVRGQGSAVGGQKSEVGGEGLSPNPQSAIRNPQSPPFIGLELTPIGPRIQDIQLRKDPAKGELEVKFELARPLFLLRPGARPIHEVPMALHLELRSAESDELLNQSRHVIGKMPEQTRTVVLRIPWSAESKSPPARARLHALLSFEEGGKFDLAFPVEFEPAKLGDVAAADGERGAP
jgi:hypothetical protein